MFFGVDTDAAARAKAQAVARAEAQELAYRERELARWVIILTSGVGLAAAFAASYYGWQLYRGRRRKTP